MNQQIKPPQATRVPKTEVVHGETRTDEYHWLRERDDPAVREYLESENAYTEGMTAHTAATQERLYREMLGRIKETDSSVPERIDDYWYYSRTIEGHAYSIYCRRLGSLDAPEEILLDVNDLARDHDFYQLGVLTVSPNHRCLAYSFDTTGSEVHRLRFKDLESGQLYPDTIENTGHAAAWANDSQTLFYTVLDPTLRPYEIRRHTLGTDASGDGVVFSEPDEAFFVSVDKTRSRRCVLISSDSKTISEVWWCSADRPDETIRVVHPRERGVEYTVDHHEDRFLILTNDGAKNFKIMTAPMATPGKEHWETLVAHDPAVKIDAIDAFRSHLVAWVRKNGLTAAHVRDWATGDAHDISFDEPAYAIGDSRNPEYDTDVLRFTYSSLTTPLSVFDYDMRLRDRTLMKRYEVLGGYDPSEYRSERLMATAPDGTQIPISLAYRGDLPRDGRRPLLLYGYGSYGLSIEPTFSSARLSLLDRNVVFAIAHIRGGGAMGRQWYEDGKMLRKRNTFTDFIAVAEHLVEQGYTSSDRLALRGGSAGGLLVGAVCMMRPDLCKAVVAEVPFVDIVNTMSDPTIPLTVTEYEEWGNPGEREFYEYMMSYSPYDNVERRAYPDLLVTAGLNDPRVQYWEPAKWVAKLRTMNTGSGVLLLKTNMGAGHRGASGGYVQLHETAFWTAFVLDRLPGTAAA